MGSVSSANPGLQNLLQTLSNLNSPVLSSPAVTSALQTASPADIVQLSEAATQLEGVDAMFGIANGSGTSSVFANLEDLATGSTGATSTATATTASGQATASSAEQLATYQTAMQAEETQALFGTGTTSGLSNSLLDLSG